jgi:hypothetical protein
MAKAEQLVDGIPMVLVTPGGAHAAAAPSRWPGLG